MNYRYAALLAEAAMDMSAELIQATLPNAATPRHAQILRDELTRRETLDLETRMRATVHEVAMREEMGAAVDQAVSG